jgi:predicted nuclease of predicted toxin-antitoxin system
MLCFKLDENADPRWREPLTLAGYEVSTVAEESLQGAEDEVVAETCQAEGRCLITVALDFAQVLYYLPENYVGIIVLRHPHPTLTGMTKLIRQIVTALSSESPVGRLWIVEPGRIRIHEPFSEGNS